MPSAYRRVLRRGDVLSALVPYVLARLPLSMAPLALLLLTQQQTGSYHRAGLVCAAYAVAVAVASPLLGRLVDRHGQSRILLATGVVHTAAMSCAALAAEHHRFGLIAASAFVAGGSLPPVTACMRVLWSKLLTDDGERHAGFAVDGVIVEVAELTGPLFVSLLLLLGRPATAVAVSGALMGLGSLAFRNSRASREVLGGQERRSPWGALIVPGVRRLLVIVVCSTATIGVVEVAMTAYARQHGGIAASGVYIGVISVGGVLAGVMFGGSGGFGARHPATVLTTVLLLSAAAAASMAEATGPVVMAGTLFIFGASISVGVIVQLGTMSTIASDDVRTEAFTWGATANFVGLGLGTAGAGWMLDRYGLPATCVVASIPTVVAAALALFSRSTFAHRAQPSEQLGTETVPDQATTAPESTAPVVVSTPDPIVLGLTAEVAELKTQVAELQAALGAALNSPTVLVGDARQRAQRMLDRADAACLEMRERADDDADRVRAAATNAALEIMAAAERDARSTLERARRDAEAIIVRARRASETAETTRPVLHALPDLDDVQVNPATDSDVAATS